MTRIAVIIISLTVVACSLLLFFGMHRRTASDISCRVIHKPKTGCPAGFTEEAGRFTEKDGSKESACVSTDEKLDDCFDVLKPGESVGFRFFVEPNKPIEAPNQKLKKL